MPAVTTTSVVTQDTRPAIVAEIDKINLTGTLIPHSWQEKLKTPSGLTDFPAIHILAQIVYWYRSSRILDSNNDPILKQRFQGDMFQGSAAYFAKQIGLTIDQSRRALKRLEDEGYIRRELRNFWDNGTMLTNVMYVEPIPSAIWSLTHPSPLSHSSEGGSQQGGVSHSSEGGVSHSSDTPLHQNDTYTRDLNKTLKEINPNGFIYRLTASQKSEKQAKEHQTTFLEPIPPTNSQPAVSDEDFQAFKAAYPKRLGSNPWPDAIKAWNKQRKDGHTAKEIIDGTLSYNAFCKATGKTGTEYVKQARTFLNQQQFLEDWTPPSTASTQSPAIRMALRGGPGPVASISEHLADRARMANRNNHSQDRTHAIPA